MKEVRRVGPAVDYRDGSEQRVLDILAGAADLSSGSDELAGHVCDWATKYHFSPQRANLLRPIRFGPGMRVLDVGAGTGALTRHVGETGAEVVALEGSLERAEAIARRCHDLENVEVVSGPLAAFPPADAGFDLVLCVGVLEHTAPEHRATLAHLRRLTRPGGVLALAIENQLGLRYLLGYAEDHLLEPWAGVEGYQRTTHVRTFSRKVLGDMLGDAGFSVQRWLFPFPDYKLPVLVLSEAAYAQPDAPGFVDQLVRWPCSAEASPPARLCDDRLAHGVFLDGGLGSEVANSFLVLAADSQDSVAELVDTSVSAWFFGAERLRPWRSPKTFRRDEGGGVVVSASVADGHRSGWLQQCRPATQPFFAGRSMEQRFLEACGRGRTDAEGVLRAWRAHLRGRETSASAEPAGEVHPFGGPRSQTLLPPDHLDVNLSNFIEVGDELVYVDREWVAPGPVDAELALLHALWGLAADLVRHGVPHPWSARYTVDELALALCGAADVGSGTVDIERWRRAEANLLATVQGGQVEDHVAWLSRTGALSHASNEVRRRLPFMELRRQLAAATHRVTVLEGRLDASQAETNALRRELAEAKEALTAARQATEAAREEATALVGHLQQARRAETAAEAAAASAARRAEAERSRAAGLAAEVDARLRHPAPRPARRAKG